MCVGVCVCGCDWCMSVHSYAKKTGIKKKKKKKSEKQERKTITDSEASNQNVLPDTAIFPAGQKVHLFFAVVRTIPFMPSVLL